MSRQQDGSEDTAATLPDPFTPEQALGPPANTAEYGLHGIYKRDGKMRRENRKPTGDSKL